MNILENHRWMVRFFIRSPYFDRLRCLFWWTFFSAFASKVNEKWAIFPTTFHSPHLLANIFHEIEFKCLLCFGFVCVFFSLVKDKKKIKSLFKMSHLRRLTSTFRKMFTGQFYFNDVGCNGRLMYVRIWFFRLRTREKLCFEWYSSNLRDKSDAKNIMEKINIFSHLQQFRCMNCLEILN